MASEQQLERLSSQDKYIQTYAMMPNSRLSSGLLNDIDECPELYRDLKEIQDTELLSVFKDNTCGYHPIDVRPRCSTDERQRECLETKHMSLVANVGEIDHRNILRLLSAGMRSIFCRVGIERGSSVQLTNDATGMKLCDISPALFSPGYSRVGLNDL